MFLLDKAERILPNKCIYIYIYIYIYIKILWKLTGCIFLYKTYSWFWYLLKYLRYINVDFV